MAVNRSVGVRQNGAIGTTPREHRLSLAGLLVENSPGVPRVGLLDPVSPVVVTGAGGWSYNVGPCNPVLVRAAADGVYLPTFTDSTAIACSVAPGSGFRYDLVWVKQNDIDKGDPDNLAYVGVTEGIASSSPAKPYADVPAGALVLSESLVSSTNTGTNQATITQVFPFTTTRGSELLVRDLTDRNTLTAREGLRVRRLDLEATVETYRNGAWRNTTSAASAGTLQTGWTAAQALKLWTPDGVTAHIGGAVKFNAGAGGNILQLAGGWEPSLAGITYFCTTQASDGPIDPVGGPTLALGIEGGMMRILYQTATVPVGSIMGIHGTWVMV